MQFRAALLAALATTASARIHGISFPKTIKPGEEITAYIGSANYIQSVYDVAIAFGINREEAAYPDTLGPVFGSFYLGPVVGLKGIPVEKRMLISRRCCRGSNQLNNIPQPVTLPESLEAGEYVIGASLLSLYGASVNPVLVGYNVTVTIGEETSEEYVNSWDEE
ncbi:unnamed protein product [Parascedosporium putredinis]|uniref:Uncharacterized protein n=1 Tax=Parascedosporium putredinis TaxID=1442378 RepID=A0A9P1GYC9_9PEZI|nr:unnamed protein product [Parascedosporium putredinis]CAI7991617.1 unnamed protein product [Parascedosporium putredinis]